MPTHLLLEGPDIESVLTELRDSHGPDAKIVQAELVRSGGFAGFFARRRYEVTVEVDEQQLAAEAISPTATPPVMPSSLPASSPAPSATSGIDALLSAAEDGDHSLIAVPARALENDQAATVSADPSPGLAQGWHRPVSTEGNAFSDVLDSLTRSLAEQQRDPEPPFEPFAAYGLPHPRVAPADATDPFDAFEVSPARPFVPPAVPPVPPVPATVTAPTPTAAGPTAPAGPTGSAGPTAPAGPTGSATASPTDTASATASVSDLASTRAQLAGLGIPARLLTDLGSPEPLLALWDVVAMLPEPQAPQLRPSATRGGALVVVVGAWSAARCAVEALLADLGTTPDAVLSVGVSGEDLPASRTVRSHAAAVDLVRTSRQQHDTTVLLVDPGLGRHSAARVAELVATVEPQYVLVAADAGADFGASLTALDALDQAAIAVDAIALDGAARAAAPAAVFEVPVPVSWVDGRPATPGAWIGLLMDVLSTRNTATPGNHRC